MKKLVVLLLLILLIFIAGCIGNKNRYEYNGFTVVKNPYGWSVTAFVTENQLEKEHIVNLKYGPKELEGIVIDPTAKDLILSSDQIYITTSPSESGNISIAVIEIGKVTGTASWGIFKIPTSSALTEPVESIDVKTCSDAINKTSVILLKTSETNKMFVENRCITIGGKTVDDVLKISDRLVLDLLGVM